MFDWVLNINVHIELGFIKCISEIYSNLVYSYLDSALLDGLNKAFNFQILTFKGFQVLPGF